MHWRLAVRTSAFLLAWPGYASAQSDNDFISYVTLITTPVGGLTPTVHAPMLSGASRRLVTIAPRFGRVTPFGEEDSDRFTNFGLTLGFPAGDAGAFAITVGRFVPSCDDCEGHFTGSVSGFVRMASSSGSMPVTVGVSGEAGFGKPADATFLAGSVGLPVSIIADATSVRFVPYVTPAFGFGRISAEGESESGARPMLGAGIVLANSRSTVGLNLGLQKTFIEGGGAVLGISLVLGVPQSVTESARKPSGM